MWLSTAISTIFANGKWESTHCDCIKPVQKQSQSGSTSYSTKLGFFSRKMKFALETLSWEICHLNSKFVNFLLLVEKILCNIWLKKLLVEFIDFCFWVIPTVHHCMFVVNKRVFAHEYTVSRAEPHGHWQDKPFSFVHLHTHTHSTDI